MSDTVKITRPAGRVHLVVRNRSRQPTLTLRLTREGGPLVREAPLSRDRLYWREVIDLPAGRYLLTEAQRPNWVCRITIQ